MGYSSLFENIQERRQENLDKLKNRKVSKMRRASAQSKMSRGSPKVGKMLAGTTVKGDHVGSKLQSQVKRNDEKWDLLEKLGNEKRKTESFSSANDSLRADPRRMDS